MIKTMVDDEIENLKNKNNQLIEQYEIAINKLSKFEANLIKERGEIALEKQKLRSDLHEFRHSNKHLKCENNKLKLENEQLNKRLEASKQLVVDLETRNNVQKEQINQYQIETLEKSNKLAILNEENKSITKKYQQVDKTNLDFKKQLEKLEKEIASYKKKENNPNGYLLLFFLYNNYNKIIAIFQFRSQKEKILDE